MAPYAQQLLYDEQVRDAAWRALEAGRDSYQRARKQSAGEALSDKKLQRRLQEAIGALGDFGAALSAPPRRRKPRRWRTLATLAVGGAALFVVVNPDAREAVLNWVGSATNSSSAD
ncbi:MAG: hypothetical protein JO181_04605 [Solirubrobacterales bacterium]|nr:hypothetical protein [Solirubrobacterales bacterium]